MRIQLYLLCNYKTRISRHISPLQLCMSNVSLPHVLTWTNIQCCSQCGKFSSWQRRWRQLRSTCPMINLLVIRLRAAPLKPNPFHCLLFFFFLFLSPGTELAERIHLHTKYQRQGLVREGLGSFLRGKCSFSGSQVYTHFLSKSRGFIYRKWG